MPGTYSQILFHFAFSTKKRTPTITSDLQPRLYEYIGGIVRGERGVLYEIGGMPDHVHLLIRWRTDQTVATLMRNLKSHSSRWVHQTFPEKNGFQWQEGYGVFSVSQSQSEKVADDIRRQAEHHRKRTFQDEFLELLKTHGIAFDERYVWD